MTLDTAQARLDALITLTNALKAHGDLSKAYETAFERVASALGKKAIKERSTAPFVGQGPVRSKQ